MTYRETLEYIHNINWSFCKPGLERIGALCEKLGHPERELSVIHIAGTNGKGSVCAMLDSILRASGRRVGLYTSPYIRNFNERMQVDGKPIENEELVELTELIRPIADTMTDKPTEFELITAIAFEYFRRKQCDIVILEVGLGGRLDSTNIIENPLLSIITDIDFDHTALLGNTIQAIAAEKAGIIKEGRPCLFGGRDSSACRTIRAIAAKKKAPFHTIDRSDYRVVDMTLDGTVFDFQNYVGLKLPLLGTYQPFNAAIVLTALRILEEHEGINGTEEQLRRGLEAVRWPARFELLSHDPIILYDGGHNPQGVSAAVKSIQTYFPEQKVNILTAVMRDKDYDEMIEILKPAVAHAFTTQVDDNPRALRAEEFASTFASHKIPATAYASVKDAMQAAIEASRQENRPLVCLGSLYLYNAAVDALEELK
ncbi:MAG: bifunctional folylpolyglutamate synthase/dihydrofolate synthase [Clostridia bacterium]|nr:bifunctional folylpolyglutamate synthase/dihydrofolate synthase [Clostridia bacterium]